MGIHLVNPSERAILDNAGDRIPIGLLSIAGNLREKGFDVDVYDLNHTKETKLFEAVNKDRNAVIGISVYTSPGYKEAVRLAKQLKGKGRLIAGGHHATAIPESLTEHFDAVIKGEGENSFPMAMSLDGVIKGVLPELSELPIPALDLLDMKNYGVEQSGRTATLITSRGCPYSCAFCGKMEKKVRYEPIQKVRTQMSQLKNLGFDSLYFLDDVFTLERKRMQQITDWAKIIDMPFRVTTRANLIDERKLDILKKNGCEWLSMGIESGNNKVLENSNKGLTTQQNANAVKWAGERGIKVKGFFIIGLPGETEFTANQTKYFARKLRKKGLTKADFYYLTPFPGTPIWNNPEKFGIEITNFDYTKYLAAGKGAKCYVNTKGLKAERIEELVEEAREEWK